MLRSNLCICRRIDAVNAVRSTHSAYHVRQETTTAADKEKGMPRLEGPEHEYIVHERKYAEFLSHFPDHTPVDERKFGVTRHFRLVLKKDENKGGDKK